MPVKVMASFTFARCALVTKWTPKRVPVRPSSTDCSAVRFGVDIRSVALRYVPDLAVHLACRASEHVHGAPGEWEEAELRFHHRGFAGAVRADYGGDRTRRYGEVAVLPDQPFAAFHRGVAEHDAVGPLFPVAAVAVHMIHRPVCTGPASRPPVRHVRQRIIAKDYDNHSH